MKVYKCDSCGVEITNPHKVGMKEFCLSVDNCDVWQVLMPSKNKRRVHLCKNCYQGLYILAKRQDLQLVKTKDVLIRNGQKYEVVIADDNIFVVCPIIYSKKEKSEIVKYSETEIYANQDTINTLEDLNFKKISKQQKIVANAIELNPCPFCGGEAVVYHQSSKYATCDGNYVHCFECGCRTKLFECFGNTGKTHDDTEKEAIESWNQRFADNGKTI